LTNQIANITAPVPVPGMGNAPGATHSLTNQIANITAPVPVQPVEAALRAEAMKAIERGANSAAVAARFKQLTGKDL
jgi:hypothetical protein